MIIFMLAGQNTVRPKVSYIWRRYGRANAYYYSSEAVVYVVLNT